MLDFTVLFILPDYARSDECCEADWIRRVNVSGASSVEDAAEKAQTKLVSILGDGDGGDEYAIEVASDSAVVAIFGGHVFDLHQP